MPRGSVKKHDYRERVLMRSYREAGLTQEEICDCFDDLSRATLNRYLAELRKLMGPERLPKRHIARWYVAARMKANVSLEGSERQSS